MIINVSYSELNSSEREITQFQAGVNAAQRELSGTICDSEEHIRNCDSKVNSRISTWKQKISTLKERIASLKDKIERKKSELQKKQNEQAELRRELDSCRPPRTVYYEETDKNGNTVTKSYVEDPDAEKKRRLQAELARVEREITEIQRELAEMQAQMEVLKHDLEVANQYLQKLELVKTQIGKAKTVLAEIKTLVANASDAAQVESESILSAIAQLEQCLLRYDSHSYASAASRGTAATFRIPELHSASFGGGGYVPSAGAARAQSSARTYAPEKESIPFPARLRLLSEKDRKVEIVGTYEDSVELVADIATVRKILGKSVTLCEKKPITTPTPCFATVKELHDFLTAEGFHAKLTAMGTRYTDMNGYIYFIS